ncbi:sulfatase [Lentisphaera profundi]|uniref:Sulfatase n=1 Tax=Lentisphaera profundi TaxID=1658616 RepID=A0ABY7VYK8_9BACT|nr:sulfatase [Lentisphaera profundi]WDE97794.1 sulfatase [Lentisphaera profundi]
MKILTLLLFSFTLFASEQPNIILFYVDDFGVKDLSCNGSSFYETPNMDRLAAGGMKFNNAYTAFPRCLPARQALLTGKYPSRFDVQAYPKQHLPFEEITFGEALKDAGYSTAYIGKWHLGHEGQDPSKQGFDHIVHTGHAGATGSFFYPFPVEKGHSVENPVKGKEGDYLTDLLRDEACEFIREKKDQPFLLVMAPYAVHTPLEGKKDLVEKYRQKLKRLGLSEGGTKDDADLVKDGTGIYKTVQNNPNYAAMIESVDTSLGKIMQTLEDLGIADNTAIILSSDHGGLSSRGLNNNRPLATSNLPYRHGKGWVYEGGIRVPHIVRWPKKIKAGTVSHVQTIGVDHYPTILQMAGLDLKPKQHIDGRTYFKALKGDDYQRDGMFWYSHTARPDSTGDTRGMAYTEGKYKIHEWFDEDSIELYDLENDPGERKDLSKQMPEKTKELHGKMLAMEESVGNYRKQGLRSTQKRLDRKKNPKKPSNKKH